MSNGSQVTLNYNLSLPRKRKRSLESMILSPRKGRFPYFWHILYLQLALRNCTIHPFYKSTEQMNFTIEMEQRIPTVELQSIFRQRTEVEKLLMMKNSVNNMIWGISLDRFNKKKIYEQVLVLPSSLNIPHAF